MDRIFANVAVLGAGAGGFGVVYRAAGNGLKVAIIDRNPGFGGTSVYAGVNCWEPGVASGSAHAKLAGILAGNSGDCGVGRTVPNINIFDLSMERGAYDTDWAHDRHDLRPWGLSVAGAGGKYEDTLGRCRLFCKSGADFRRFQYRPEAMTAAMNAVLAPYMKNILAFFQSEYLSCRCEGRMVKSVVFSQGQRTYEVCARYFVDCSGDIVLAREAGCSVSFGTEGAEVYAEPSVAKPDLCGINGVSILACARKTPDPEHVDTVPEQFKLSEIRTWKNEVLYKNRCVSQINACADGSLNINMLPTLTGQEYCALGPRAREVGAARLWAYWNYLQERFGLRGFTLCRVFDMPGIREGYRLKGRYVLTEVDVRKGFSAQPMRDEFIAYGDHALDIHGTGGMCRELERPYGVPFSCLETVEYDNLLVACRGASLSHVAASSCRLTRTMLALGEAAGEALAQLCGTGRLDLGRLRTALGCETCEAEFEKAL